MEKHKKDIIAIGKKLYDLGFISSGDGNISIRVDENKIITTPTGLNKGNLKRDELVVVDMKGKKISGKLEPSSELLMHLCYYENRPDVKAVVHAHPPYCTGFATAGISLEKCVLPEVILTVGSIPLAPYGTPSTTELTDTIKDLVPKCDAILLSNHGAVTAGTDAMDAYWKMERIEHAAKISYIARTLGGEKVLPKSEVKKLYEIKDKYGSGGPHPVCWDCEDCIGEDCVLHAYKDEAKAEKNITEIDNIVEKILNKMRK